ncbi:DUF1131 domain-containing protein [Caulobacter sp. ErkDOM-E]|uniref:DUF1131 domain-containing protein n=1 Tax=Caulobacter sp. ErkDOM-E TaxID=3402778 RepID=UPI003AF73734
MRLPLALIAVPLALLAACGPADKPAPPASPPSAAAPAAGTGSLLALDEYAVGPIMAQTPFRAEAIQALFPNDRVATESSVITVARDGVTMLKILGEPGLTTVGEIHIAGRSATGPRGEVFGMPWPRLDVPPKRCWMGQAAYRHAVICTQPGESVLRYVFEVPGWTTDALPPTEMLAKATLRDFIWKSGAGGYAPNGGGA